VLPDAVWARRDQFFFDGMRLEVGPCFADYSAPDFLRTVAKPGTARLVTDGGLEGYAGGIPFAPVSIARSDPDAGLKWAWNSALRYQGAGFRGKFRVVDLGTDKERQSYTGEIFKIALPPGDDTLWVAGGEFTAPFDARNFAWRQYRTVASLRDAGDSDEVQAYLPAQQRVRRLPSARIEGLYVPTFSVGSGTKQALAVPSGGGLPSVGAGPQSAGGVASPDAVTTDVGVPTPTSRSGFEGLAIRPNLWTWRVLEVRDVLAPINAAQPMYPAVEDRNFGPTGLSLADRWDLRRALVLEARGKDAAAKRGRTIWYLDMQTLVPLYVVTEAEGGTTDVAIYAHRWSEGRNDYPRWPDAPDRPIRALDPVAAVYASSDPHGSWRRESWDFVATPPSAKEVEHLRSVASLTRGH
jgi:Protein of unknown function (DUF1329)